MDMVFEENIKEEKKLHAYVNFFKLMIIAQRSDGNYEAFCLMGGMEKLAKLICDKKEGNIIFDDMKKGEIYSKQTKDLYYEMLCQSVNLSNIKFSGSALFQTTQEEVDKIRLYYNSYQSVLSTPSIETAFDNLTTAETELKNTLPLEARDRLEQMITTETIPSFEKKLKEGK